MQMLFTELVALPCCMLVYSSECGIGPSGPEKIQSHYEALLHE